MHRRHFLGTLGSAATLPLLGWTPRPTSPRTKRILVLGGTNFVGPAVVTEAVARGHEVTLFNRGITRPHLFPELERLRGHRSIDGSELTALGDARRWDAVIDVWPEHRGIVRETAERLRDRTDYYFYVSSIAAYADFSVPGLTESGRVRSGPPGSYGAEKAAAEDVVRSVFPDRYGVARCHAIVGPYDPGASFHYWLRKLATRDEVLCPGSGRDPVQVIDVRDLARWVLDSIDANRVGTFNATGAWPPPTMQQFLTAAASGVGSTADLVWVDADFLRRDQGVYSFSDMPLWAPLDEDEGFYQIDGSAALREGMRHRAIPETAADSWTWFQSHFFKDVRFPHQGVGLSDERENEVLAAWRASRRG